MSAIEESVEVINVHQAQAMKELISPRQLVAARSFGHSARVNHTEVSETLFGCEAETLTIRAASSLITALHILAILRGAGFCTVKQVAASMPKTYPATVQRALEMLALKGWIETRGHGAHREYGRVEFQPDSSSIIAFQTKPTDRNCSGSVWLAEASESIYFHPVISPAAVRADLALESLPQMPAAPDALSDYEADSIRNSVESERLDDADTSDDNADRIPF